MLWRVGTPIRFGLRGRMVASFALGALVAAAALGLVTYASTRNYLENQRMEVALRQAFNNAQLVRTVLSADRSNVASLVTNVRSEQGGYAVLHVENDGSNQPSFFAQEPLRFTQSNLPAELLTQVLAGRTGTERFEFDGEPYQAVGVAVPSAGIQYFEVFPMSQVDRTMALVGTTLVLGAVGSAVLAGLLGLALSRSVLRPLSRVAGAARRIASGGLDTRLASEDDRELAQLVESFNGMADAVQARIEREQRFSSDVSHELRSPVTALSAAVQSISGRAGDLPPRTAQAVEIIEQQVVRLDRTVRDLLELSRLRFGISNLHIHAGAAPDGLALLPPRPDRVLLEVGRPLGDVLAAVWQALQPGGRLVISTASLEGLVDATDTLGQLAAIDLQVVQATVHRMQRRGSQAKLAAAEPLFLIAAERP